MQPIFTEFTVTISREQWEEVTEQLRWLDCLESAGVDNWGGIDYASELYLKDEEDDD